MFFDDIFIVSFSIFFSFSPEFLNVDEDDEEDEDNTQFAADPSFLENSGWSSRTRHVLYYLYI